eukprot:218752-Alexandrium_andersonii.AAC.1
MQGDGPRAVDNSRPLIPRRYLPALTPNSKRLELEAPELELRGPRNGPKIDPRSSRGARSA